MKEEKIYEEILENELESLDLDNVNVQKIMRIFYFGSLSFSRNLSIYFFSLGKRIGEKLGENAKVSDVKKASIAAIEILKRLFGHEVEVEFPDDKVIIRIKEAFDFCEKATSLSFTRGFIVGFLTRATGEYVLLNVEGRKIKIEVVHPDELVREILG